MFASRSTADINFFQHILGTTRGEVIGSLIIIFIGFVIIYTLLLSHIVRWVLDYLDYRRLQERQLVFLEITPPTVTTKTLQATAQLYAHLHGLLGMATRQERRWHRKHLMSLEIVGTRAEGIRFIATLSPYDLEIFIEVLVSYLPDVKFQEVEDYLPKNLEGQNVRILDFKQFGHQVLPIALHNKLEEHDPMASLTSALSRTLPDELVVYHLVLSPASRRVANKIRHQLLHGNDKAIDRKLWHWPFIIVWKVLQLVSSALMGLLEILGDGFGDIHTKPEPYKYKPTQLSPTTQHVIEPIHHKLDQPLFSVDMRVIVIGSDSGARSQAVANALHQFQVPGYQGFTTRRNFPKKYVYPYRVQSFRKRLPSMFTDKSNVLAADEVASLWHFPYGTRVTENLQQSFSKSLPAPANMKVRADNETFDVVLGINRHHGNLTPIGLTAEEREKHVYVVGGTGNGKTTMLEGAILQDILNGKGVAVIDPHGDLAQDILTRIPEFRIKDVVFFDPYDIAHPMGLNLLELPDNLSPDDLALQKDFVMEAVISIFRKVFSEDDSGGHRIESVLRNTILTAFTVPDATLFTIYDLLTDVSFRNKVVAQLDNKRLKQFWEGKISKAGNMQLVKMTDGVNTKLERFNASEAIRRVIEQPKSTIVFDDIINSGKILICKFGKGAIGNDTAELFGITIMAKLQLAAQRRIHIKPSERKPFYLYVDEFQTFATLTFVEMLAEARKFKLYLTMAEQSTAQQEEQRIVHIILDNVGTIICFRFGSPKSEELLLPLFKPFLDPGEISKLSAYNFYMSVRALQTQEPFSGETVRVAEDDASEAIAEQVIEESRERYGTLYVAPKPEAMLQTEIKPGSASPDKLSVLNRPAVGRRRNAKKSKR